MASILKLTASKQYSLLFLRTWNWHLFHVVLLILFLLHLWFCPRYNDYVIRPTCQLMKPQVRLMIFFVAFILYLFCHKSLTKPKQYCLWNRQELFLILLFLSSSPSLNESLSMRDLTSKLKQQPLSFLPYALGTCSDLYYLWHSSLQFIRSVVSDSLWPHGLQHARPPCPSPALRVCSNSCPLSRWCHPTISCSVIPFSSRLQSFPASGSFLVSQFFASGGQSIGVSASASVLPMNIQDWFPLGWTRWILLAVQGTLKSLLQDSLTQTTEIFSFPISLLIFPLFHCQNDLCTI